MLTLSFITRLWDFGITVAGYWYVWVTTVPFVIDQGLSHQFLPKWFVDLADAWWPPNRRHRILKSLCVLGFIVASFQAYDNVSERLREAQTQIPKGSKIRWEPLSANETVALRSELRNIPREHLSVLCGFAGCADLADSLYAVVHDLNWTGTYEGMYFSDGGIKVGIEIWSYSQKVDARNKIVEAIERATKGRLAISSQQWDQPPSPENANDINLIIGRVR